MPTEMAMSEFYGRNNSFATYTHTYTRIRSHNGQIYSTVNEHAILSRLIHLYGYDYLG